MSKRAEDFAIEYADKKLQAVDHELWETGYTRYRKMSVRVMDGSDVEQAYQDGYEQAEKDLALTWKDIDWILTKGVSIFTFAQGTLEDCCNEVLRRFNEQRKK